MARRQKNKKWIIALILTFAVAAMGWIAVRAVVIYRIHADPILNRICVDTVSAEIIYCDLHGTVSGGEAIQIARRFVELAKFHGAPFPSIHRRCDSADGWIRFLDKDKKIITQLYLYGNELPFCTGGEWIFTLRGAGYVQFEDEIRNALEHNF